MKDFEIKVTSRENVYWANTDEFTFMVNDNQHTVRYVEDSNGGEILYKHPTLGWVEIYEADQDPEVMAIIEAWDSGDLDLYLN